VKHLKFLILACGGLGLAMILVSDFNANFESHRNGMIVLVACFAIPTLMALAGILKPPAQTWQALLSLAAFGLAGIERRIWETLPKITEQPTKFEIELIAIAAGIVVSALALAKSESTY
jgi:hypothetical protein